MSDAEGWTVNSNSHSFEEAVEDYYMALLQNADTPMPEWLAWLKGDDQ